MIAWTEAVTQSSEFLAYHIGQDADDYDPCSLFFLNRFKDFHNSDKGSYSDCKKKIHETLKLFDREEICESFVKGFSFDCVDAWDIVDKDDFLLDFSSDLFNKIGSGGKL